MQEACQPPNQGKSGSKHRENPLNSARRITFHLHRKTGSARKSAAMPLRQRWEPL